ncbi:MAG TPA: HAD family phosphatase [Planctomycetaceae bacterium]|nr:HAD family phosphatase [Planctomycetaceae bacterium]
MTLPIRAVCFDLDGLMFNTEHVFFEAGGELLRRRGKEMTLDVMNVLIGRRPLESFKSLVDYLQLTETPEALLDESRTIFHAMLAERLAPMPGLFGLLDAIEARGLPKGVATSSPRYYLNDVLSQFNLLPRFAITLTSEDVTHGKPNPEIYLKAAELLGVSPVEMLVMEDSAAGTAAAVAAGAHVVSIPHEFTAGHNFVGAKHIAGSLADPYIYGLLH